MVSTWACSRQRPGARASAGPLGESSRMPTWPVSSTAQATGASATTEPLAARARALRRTVSPTETV